MPIEHLAEQWKQGKFITMTELAKRLGVPKQTLSYRLARHRVPSHRLGQLRLIAVEFSHDNRLRFG